MKYLHLFSTTAEHDAVYNGSNYQEPWVAKISANNKVTYNNSYATYVKEYMTTVALNTGTISFTIHKNVNVNKLNNISYSTNNGITWNTTQNANDKSEDILIIVNVKRGDKILWKGSGLSLSHNSFNSSSKFSGTVKFTVEGNIMSLLYGDIFINLKTLYNYAFCYLFSSTQVINAKNLILPATTLGNYCYAYMFRGCTSLTKAPELPATTLADSCYYYMFYGCTSLTTAPELPATTLVNECYHYMFYNCTNLNYIKAMFTTTPSNTYTNSWVAGVASTGTFIKNLEATWDVTGVNGVPPRWTVIYPPIAELYFDDYPNDDEKNIWDDYDDIVARSIEDPDGYGCNKMIYKGQTIEIDGLTYHIWDYNENDSMKILTNTVDSDILTSQSLAANYLEYVDSGNTVSEDEQNLVNNITFDSLYGVMMNDSLYETGYDNTWVQEQRLVKYVKL